ncbi:aromatic ring-hydroxylating oxygenase subunit alpha [Microcoleus sp. FACHB-672]|uniref:aromatic ring-hydroxylating dioxygenase subunit alpha n=1 Tax=Microcoleus sp. FACHB-672 TaxID=2692825 RepID=UPI0016880ECA|nr:aromatic ring-hydroxylating dioxygenase subunit alpha [Microcoleus sp. FACHB-672]MBD2043659.1 aromatic ring-hydroxylating dioxygenase subunit alpha [Microcoleus sp. FACHB-672]
MVTSDAILLNGWHVVAKSEDLQPATILPARLLGENLVLWRNGDRIMAWKDVCPHRGARLSIGNISGDTLICPYHGLAYDTTGQCTYIPAHPDLQPPARAHVQTYQAYELYDLIWVRLGADSQGTIKDKKDASEVEFIIPPSFPEWENPAFHKFLCGSYTYHSSGFRAIENFLDVSHFPFVHDGLLGDRNRTATADYEVEVEENGISLRNVRVWQPDPDGTGTGGEVTYNYRVLRPLTAYFVKQSPAGELTIFFTVTPVDEEECLGWMWITMNYGHEIPEAELRAFQDKVVRQDIPIVESQQPKRLPLDLPAEFHLPCDRASIAYRKWLKQLGVTFGTV